MPVVDLGTVAKIAGVYLLLLSTAPASAQVAVDTCGQVVSDSGVLVADLDCVGVLGPYESAVTLRGGKRELDLAGFTVRGGRYAVECEGNCSVTSSAPGAAIADATLFGIYSCANLKLENVAISDNGSDGVRVGNRGRLANLSLSGNGGSGVSAGSLGTNCSGEPVGRAKAGALRLDGVSATNNGRHGVSVGGKVKLQDTIASFNASRGVFATQIAARDSTIEGNGAAGLDAGDHQLPGRKMIVRRCSVIDNAWYGIVEGDPYSVLKRFQVRDSEVTGNGWGGIVSKGTEVTPEVRNTKAIGNTLGPACSSGLCGDIATAREPRVDDDVQCDTSYVQGSGVPGTNWGICALD